MQTFTTIKCTGVFTLCIILLSSIQLLSQTVTWSPPPTGGDTNWHNTANWSSGTVPGPGNDVIIPNSIMYPIISAPAFAKSITINDANASLTVNDNLTIDNSSLSGITNSGLITVDMDGVITIDNTGQHGILMFSGASIVNSGDINIGTLGGVDNIMISGIRSFGNIHNMTGGQIMVKETIDAGIALLTGATLTNDGMIDIEEVNFRGVSSGGSVTNNTGGTIQISGTGDAGYYVISSSPFDNSGTINIDDTGSQGILFSTNSEVDNSGTINIDDTGSQGILLRQTSEVDNSGIINIDNTVSHGIEIEGSLLDNTGIINIGTIGGTVNIGVDGIRLNGTINNLTGGEVYISETTSAGIALLGQGSTLINDGLIETNKNGREGIFNGAALTNNGTIEIDQTTLRAFQSSPISMTTNNGILTIGATAPVGFTGIRNSGIFLNTSIGTISIERAIEGIENNSNALFTNDGDIFIATNIAVLNNGIETNNTSAFINNNMIIIGGGAIGQDGISVEGSSTFNNSFCAVIELNDIINNISINAMAFTNDGYIELNTSEVHVPGIFDNGGLIYDIQGTLPTDGVDFNNTNIVIAPKLDVFCDLTVISDAFVYGGSNPYMIDGIYTDANATVIAGSYNSATNEFIPTAPLVPNSSYTYYIKLSDSNGTCSDVIVEWLVTTSNNIVIAPTIVFCDLTMIPDAFDLNVIDPSMVDGVYLDANAMTSAGNYDAITNTFTPTVALMPNSSYTYYVKINVMNVSCIIEWLVTTSNNIVIAPTIVFCDLTMIPDAFDLNVIDPSMVDGVYLDANAMTSAGNYDAVTNIFTPTVALMPNSSYTFYVKINVMNAPFFCVIEWSITTTSDIITFDGGGDGIDWHDPDNWDQDIVPTFCHHVIIPSLFTVEVKNNSMTAEGKTLDVRPFAGFETLPGGLVHIEN